MKDYSSTFSPFAETIRLAKYAHIKEDGTKESWPETTSRVVDHVMAVVPVTGQFKQEIKQLIIDRKFLPGGRYLASAGRPYHQVQNCILLKAEDSREGWAEHLHNSAQSLMTGAGIGTEYSAIRPKGSPIRRTGGIATGPIELMKMTNECGRGIRQGGSRRSAIWAGLNWQHQDVFEFIHLKDWSPEVSALKEKDFNFPAPMDGTNISVGLDDLFFTAYNDLEHPLHSRAEEVYWEVVRQMLKTGEPGFSINIGKNSDETLRNACNEITSADDSDICNIGSINMARIESIEEMIYVVERGTAFLLAGSVYSDVPYPKVGETREKNRRIGLGLMGLHEWMLQRGMRYGASDELQKYLEEYRDGADFWSGYYAAKWGTSVPVKTRAIAPTGTIGIIAETTGGIEPVFCVAFKRRYLESGTSWAYQYVIDTMAQKLIDSGVKPEDIEDAYSLAKEPQRRVQFQAWLQSYVDHGISSTINLPAWGTEFNNESLVTGFGEMLMQHLPRLRGITVYPDGARGGQPLTSVRYSTAAKHLGQVYYEQQDVCSLTGAGSCGS